MAEAIMVDNPYIYSANYPSGIPTTTFPYLYDLVHYDTSKVTY